MFSNVTWPLGARQFSVWTLISRVVTHQVHPFDTEGPRITLNCLGKSGGTGD